MNIKSTLSSMNLARWIILVGALGTVALVVTGWLLHEERVACEASLRPGGQVEKLASSIQALGKECTKLQKDADRVGLSKQADAVSYIRELARNPAVNVGMVVVGTLTPASPARGVTDVKYQIKPQEANQTFSRDNIGNFMWKLESDSGRLRVTNLRIWQEQKLKEWEIGNDLWKYEAEVTSRQKDEVAPAPAAKKS